MFELIVGLITNHEVATSVGINALLILILHFLDKRAIAPFLKGYSEQVGQNRAMKENLDNLVIQTEKLTTSTENIKAKISDEQWNRQRQWEMRRDTVFELMRALGELDCALVDLQSIYLSQIPESDELKKDRSNKMKEIRHRLYACETKFNSIRFLTEVVVGEGLNEALNEFDKEIRHISAKIIDVDHAYFNKVEVVASLVRKRDSVEVAARKELDIKNK
jgi:hypothetical protein